MACSRAAELVTSVCSACLITLASSCDAPMMLYAARTRSSVSTNVATRGPMSLRTVGIVFWISDCTCSAEVALAAAPPIPSASMRTLLALPDAERFSTSATAADAFSTSAFRSLPLMNCKKSGDSSPVACSRFISVSSAALACFSFSVEATTARPARCTSPCAAFSLASAVALTVAACCSIAVACAPLDSAVRLTGSTSPSCAATGLSAVSNAALSPSNSCVATSTAFCALASPASASRTIRFAPLPSPNTLSQRSIVCLSAGDSSRIAAVTSVSLGRGRVIPTPRSAPRSTLATPRSPMVSDAGATRS